MKVTFTVPGKPVGLNSAYKRAGTTKGRKGFYMTKAAVAFKEHIRARAMLADRPAMAAIKAHGGPYFVEIETYNCRHDADSPTKFILDALEGLYYENDRKVYGVIAHKNKDDLGPRVKITVGVIE